MRKEVKRTTVKLLAFLAAGAICIGLAKPVSADSTESVSTDPQLEAVSDASLTESVGTAVQTDAGGAIEQSPDIDVSPQADSGGTDEQAAIVGDSEGSSATSYQGTNIDAQNYYWYASTVKSYLVSLDNGFMRVQAGAVPAGSTSPDPGIFIVQYFDNNCQLTETREIDLDLPIWGGFCSYGNYYYILSGQDNPDESDDQEVYRVTKYDTSWNVAGTASLCGANTYSPFAAGSARMVCSNGHLLIRTCHTMYKTSDGYHHQANVMIEVDTSSMEVTDSFTEISNVGEGYVSHSFNQFIDTDGNQIVAVDHGDAYPRSVVLVKYNTDYTDGNFSNYNWWADDGSGISNVNLLSIPGETGDNNTGVSVGGFEQSDSQYIVAGNSVNFNDINYKNLTTKNIFVSTVAKDLGSDPVITYITNYAEGDPSASTPQLVKTGSTSFLLLWATDGVVNYTTLDGSGKQTSGIYQMNGALSDCKPVVRGNEVIWYTWKDSRVYFYSINIDDLSKHLVYHPASVSSTAFTDVKSPSYYEDSVLWAVKNDITNGKDTNHFDPNGTTTRAEAVTFLWRAAGCPVTYDYTDTYDDVQWNTYYYYAVMWASDRGITYGTTATAFSPNAPVTRAQMATFLWRYASKPAPAGDSPFVDVNSKAYYGDAVVWAYENEITSGTDATHFDPVGVCKREHIVTMMQRAKTLLGFPQ